MTPPDISGTLPRILVTDDSRIVRATVKKHLSTSFDIIEEADGEAAWERLLADTTVQVLISDLSMPRLDGYGLLARVRNSSDHRIKNLPVIIISGEEEGEAKQLAVDRGANDFITKSTDRAEMIARVSAAAQLSKTARELHATQEVQTKTATTDAVTGLGTQHLLELEGGKALAFAHRHHSEVTLLLIEIDAFAEVAKQIGDAVSQQMLQLLSKLMASKLRKEETLAHLEEARFGLVLPGARVQDSLVLADRLKQTIAAARINYKGQQLKVTASVGVANSVIDGVKDIVGLFDASMARLSKSVEAGGNLVSAPEVPAVSLPPLPLAAAIEQLRSGGAHKVKPHLATLLSEIRPLLEYANKELDLGWNLSKLPRP
ncbi:GGDEF domain-containing response regulator [Parachitinimonas caeni]|uniref:Response regulator n=1 Tax=Parachitinimonas caeni TaxID=3031301 RepID=A0ABT7DUS9_9NEIS|nr:diguanylate cyclase [Parachitinimonas caeni]MDK2123831.1 response regulator [Parachitinimonas caeni]